MTISDIQVQRTELNSVHISVPEHLKQLANLVQFNLVHDPIALAETLAAADADTQEWAMETNTFSVEITGDRVTIVNDGNGQETSLDRALFADVLRRVADALGVPVTGTDDTDARSSSSEARETRHSE